MPVLHHYNHGPESGRELVLALWRLRRSLECGSTEYLERRLSMAVSASMPATPFPASPSAVAVLTVAEFTSELDTNDSMELDTVCQHFLSDANRALVCLIRFRALTTWRERTDIAQWLQSHPSHAQHACKLAASFALNADWEFDASRFRSAVARSA